MSSITERDVLVKGSPLIVFLDLFFRKYSSPHNGTCVGFSHTGCTLDYYPSDMKDRVMAAAASTDSVKTVNRVPLVRSLNCHITCGVCKGYLIDATTVTECLHSFCRSCVVHHVTNKSHTCPSCGLQFKETKLSSLLKSDHILQSFVYKVVPNLAFDELKRRRTFHRAHSQKDDSTDAHELKLKSYFGTADPISLSLEYANPDSDKSDNESQHSDRRYFRCPAALPIGHLMKFLLDKYEVDSLHYQAEILFDGCPLSPTEKLLDVAYTFSWNEKAPLKLWFRFVKLAPVDSAAIQKSCTQESSSSRETTDTAPIKEASNLNKPSQSLKKLAEILDAPSTSSNPLSPPLVPPCGESHHQAEKVVVAIEPAVASGESRLLANVTSTRSEQKDQPGEEHEKQSATGSDKHDSESDREISLSVETAHRIKGGGGEEEGCLGAKEPGNEEAEERQEELDSTRAAAAAEGNLPAIVIDSREKCKINAPPDVTSQISVDSTTAAATGVSDSEKPITKSWVPRAVFDLDDPTLLGKRLQKQSEANASRTDPYLTNPSSSNSSPTHITKCAKQNSDISVFDFEEPTLPDRRHCQTSTNHAAGPSLYRPFSSLRSSRDANEPLKNACSTLNEPAKRSQNHQSQSSSPSQTSPTTSSNKCKDVKKASEVDLKDLQVPGKDPQRTTESEASTNSPPSSSKDAKKASERPVTTLGNKRLNHQKPHSAEVATTTSPSDSSSRPGSSSSSSKDGEKPSGSRKTKRQELTSIIDSIFESKRLKQDAPVKTQDERVSASAPPSHTGAGSAFSIERLSVPDSGAAAATLTRNAQGGGGGGGGGSSRSKALIIDGTWSGAAAPVHDSIGALDLSSRPSEPIASPTSKQPKQLPAKSSPSPTATPSQGPHPFFLSSPTAAAAAAASGAGPAALYDPLSLLKVPLGAPRSLDPGKKAVHEWLSLISHQLEVSRKLSPAAMHAAARPVPPLKRLSCSPAESGGLATAPSFRSTKATQAALLKLPQGPLCTAAANGSRTKQLSAHVRHIPNPSLMQLQRRLASNLPCYLPSKD